MKIETDPLEKKHYFGHSAQPYVHDVFLHITDMNILSITTKIIID